MMLTARVAVRLLPDASRGGKSNVNQCLPDQVSRWTY